MTPDERLWFDQFATQYGIPLLCRYSAYDALSTHFPPARRKPDPRDFYCEEEPLQ